MGLDRDELAARNMVAAIRTLDAEVRVPPTLADFAVECADALIARLRPATVAPVADAAPRPEWVRITSLPLGDDGRYPFAVGQVFKVAEWEDSAPRVIGPRREGITLSASGASIDPRHPGFATWEPCAAPATAPDHPTAASFAARRGQGAAGDQRVAAGLDAPAKPAPAVDREAFTTLLDAVKWVLNDAAFKAPEQMGEVAERWVSRLERAIDSLPPSLTNGGAS